MLAGPVAYLHAVGAGRRGAALEVADRTGRASDRAHAAARAFDAAVVAAGDLTAARAGAPHGAGRVLPLEHGVNRDLALRLTAELSAGEAFLDKPSPAAMVLGNALFLGARWLTVGCRHAADVPISIAPWLEIAVRRS